MRGDSLRSTNFVFPGPFQHDQAFVFFKLFPYFEQSHHLISCSVCWMFSKSTDTQGAWNHMELRKFGEDMRVTVMDVINGKEIKYPWHNSNIGGVSPMFQNQLETFVRFAYDKPSKELVVSAIYEQPRKVFFFPLVFYFIKVVFSAVNDKWASSWF